MSLELGRLEVDPLFLGLTRPPQIAGVSYLWFSIQGMFWALFFINTKDFATLIPGALATHFLGFIINNKEPKFTDIWLTRVQHCMKCRNTKFHGNTHSYDLFK